MRRILTQLTALLSFAFLVGCFPTDYYKIYDIELTALELSNPEEQDKEKWIFKEADDVFKDRILLGIVPVPELSHVAGIHNVSLVSKCYATSRPSEWDNHILYDKLELKLDHDIYFNSNLIEKGTNLWAHPLIKEYRLIIPQLNNYVWGKPSTVVGFIDSFYDKAVIPEGKYTIKVTCVTDDGLSFVKSVEMNIELGSL